MTLVRRHAVQIGGGLYVIAVSQFFILELVAETLYHGYSVATNYISDLGATCAAPPSTLVCVVHQPSARIFDVTVFVLGLLLLLGALLVCVGTRRWLYPIACVVADLAILLIGVFPENTGWTHAIISEVAFLCTGLSLILAVRVTGPGPMRYLTIAFGLATLFFTVTDVPANAVGVGGQEPILVLSALLGVLALGGNLAGTSRSVDPRTSATGRSGNQGRIR